MFYWLKFWFWVVLMNSRELVRSCTFLVTGHEMLSSHFPTCSFLVFCHFVFCEIVSLPNYFRLKSAEKLLRSDVVSDFLRAAIRALPFSRIHSF